MATDITCTICFLCVEVAVMNFQDCLRCDLKLAMFTVEHVFLMITGNILVTEKIFFEYRSCID